MRLKDSHDDVSVEAKNKHNRLMSFLCFSVWLLIVFTFTRPGRLETQAAGSIDWVAMSKMLSKGLAGAALVIGIASYGSRERWKATVSMLLPLSMFAGWGLLSTGWSALASVSAAQSMCFAVLVLLAWAVCISVTSLGDLGRLLKHTSLALATVSLILIVTRVCLPQFGHVERALAGKGTAGLLHPTVASSTAALGILIQWMGWHIWNWDWGRRHALWIVPCHLIVLLLANTRWANLLTFVLVAWILLQVVDKTHLVKGCLAIGITIIALLSVDPALRVARAVTEPIVEFSQRGQSVSQLSRFSGRSEIWKVMWESLQDAPLMGHGFYVTSQEGSVRVWHARGNFTAHNIWLQSLVTTGIIGTLLLALGLLNPVFELVRFRAPNGEGRRWKVTLCVLLTWFLGWSLLNVSFLAPFQPEAVVFFIVIGLCGGLRSSRSLLREEVCT